MRKLVFLSMFGLMSVGVFASNGEEAPKLLKTNVESTISSTETVETKVADNAVKAQIL